MRAAPAVLAEFRALRKAMGLTQPEAAAIVGLAKSTVAVYECGQGNITEARVRQLIEKLRQARTETPVYLRTVIVDEPSSQANPRYVPAPPRLTPKPKVRTCPLPRGAVDENDLCICRSSRKRHDALKFSCQDCRRGSTGCQYFRPASRFNGAS